MKKRTRCISAIVVTYNSAQTIESCLKCLKEALNFHESEIIVVDNASKDDTRDIVLRFLPDSKPVLLPRNLGFAAGVNAGITHSHGQYILLVNPDLFLNSGCIQGMLQFMKDHKDVGAVGPKLIYPSGERQPSCRRYPAFRAILASQFPSITKWMWRGILTHYLMGETELSEPLEVDWLMGACILIKHEVIEDVGGLDDRFFLYREDTDWCLRARQKGRKIFYLPKMETVHKYERQSARGMNRQFVWHIKSMILFYRKHGFRW
jgi:N-acetylglucosaminyl-diphospho-decaprenol L-rhamnosyltransferase